MKKILKKIGKILLFIVAGLLVIIAALVINSKLYKVEVAPSITNSTGLIQAQGRGLYDANGQEIILEGTNFGGWTVTEGWLVPYCIEEPTFNEKGEPQYLTLSTDEFLNAFAQNPNLTKEQINELLDLYYRNWITQQDVKNVRELGANAVRLPFSWRMFLNDDFSRKPEEEAFKVLDRVIAWCKEEGLYVILDLHCCPGSQSGYEHAGTQEYEPGNAGVKYIELYSHPEYIDATVDVWAYISKHYSTTAKDLSGTIAMYDLINEPRDVHLNTNRKVWDIYDRIYDQLRSQNDQHVLCMEGIWNFWAMCDPADYGWENVCYSYHWYNFQQFNWDLFYAYEDFFNIGKDYDVPVFIGEFSYFENEAAWHKGIDLFRERHYSWTTWTYKKVVSGWWNDSWGIYNLKMYDDATQKDILKVNVTTATYEEIAEAFSAENIDTSKAVRSSTYNIMKDLFSE